MMEPNKNLLTMPDYLELLSFFCLETEKAQTTGKLAFISNHFKTKHSMTLKALI